MTREEAQRIADMFANGAGQIEAILAAVAVQRQRDAELCRKIHSTSRQRVELALLCAREIEASGVTAA